MADRLTAKRRSDNMSRIRSKDMKPEMVVRQLVHGLGYRYRLHGRDLPGKPDLIFRSRRKVIFVHGCFWHQHPALDCPDGARRKPKSNTGYWNPKLQRNIERDSQNQSCLQEVGWDVLIIWECETEDQDRLTNKLQRFLRI
jgi:DNA mismatch endonuclease (patch repair protein)